MSKLKGNLRKLSVDYNPTNSKVCYHLNLDDNKVLNLNDLIGEEVKISFFQEIYSIYSNKRIRKSYNQGYSYDEFLSLARNDICIMKPELCHYHKGTCREEQWAEKFCFQKHSLYVARGSNIKIGITRTEQEITRWVDQGAVQAKTIAFFKDRFAVGKAEKFIANYMSDRSQWQKSLKNELTEESIDTGIEKAMSIKEKNFDCIDNLEGKVYDFDYPVLSYPKKIKSIKLDKTSIICDVLTGIKGQYLFFGENVFNVRSHGGYNIIFEY